MTSNTDLKAVAIIFPTLTASLSCELSLNKNTIKNIEANERHFGYKDHINADEKIKLITNYSVTSAEKAYRGSPLTEEQKNSNNIKSKIRARVEHIFSFMKTL